jgi:hypothetical protein
MKWLAVEAEAYSRAAARPDKPSGRDSGRPNKPLHLTRRAGRILKFKVPRARRAGELGVRRALGSPARECESFGRRQKRLPEWVPVTWAIDWGR